MFPLAHFGLGSVLVFPWWKRLRFRWFFLGAVLPDILDKSFYYLVKFAELADLLSRRAMGHSILLLLLLAAVARWRRSLVLFSVFMGALTHVILDFSGNSWFYEGGTERNLAVLCWPFLGWSVQKLNEPIPLELSYLLEVVGLILLVGTYVFRRAKYSDKNP